MQLILGDCLEVMRELPDESVDAVVTDPPYDLLQTSRNGSRRTNNPDNPYGRHGEAKSARGFMGKTWDGTGIAFRVETWSEAFRVAKPGAHLLAFGGTRTYHRLAAAIEDAGWEIRDCLVWGYASGFPKSLDVGKAIDRANGKYDRDLAAFGTYIKACRIAKGWSLRQLDEAMGTNTAASWWEGRKAGVQPPGLVVYRRLKAVLGMDDRYDSFIEWIEAKRDVIGRSGNGLAPLWVADGNAGYRPEFDLTAPATDDAKRWNGWGTALKPAWEPIVLARKPLRGTVAQNVLEYGTGALNIDGTRIPGLTETTRFDPAKHSHDGYRMDATGAEVAARTNGLGRWPANIVLTDPIFDGGVDGVVGGGESEDGVAVNRNKTPGAWSGNTIYGARPVITEDATYGGAGTYSRFFLIPKAARSDREPVLRGQLEPTHGQRTESGHATWCERCGLDRVNVTPRAACQCAEPQWSRVPKAARENLHPTVKPLELMRHLVRLVTPPGGTVLDPFLGSGTTAIACEMEGFQWIGIEKEPEYVEIAKARLNGVQRGLGLDVQAPTRKRTTPSDAKMPAWKNRPADLPKGWNGGWAGDQPEEVA